MKDELILTKLERIADKAKNKALANDLKRLARKYRVGHDLDVFIEVPGDRSTGIDHTAVQLSLPKYLVTADESGTRKLLQEVFADLMDDPNTSVRFGNECPDCNCNTFDAHSGQCSNKTCISNMPDDVD